MSKDGSEIYKYSDESNITRGHLTDKRQIQIVWICLLIAYLRRYGSIGSPQ